MYAWNGLDTPTDNACLRYDSSCNLRYQNCGRKNRRKGFGPSLTHQPTMEIGLNMVNRERDQTCFAYIPYARTLFCSAETHLHSIAHKYFWEVLYWCYVGNGVSSLKWRVRSLVAEPWRHFLSWLEQTIIWDGILLGPCFLRRLRYFVLRQSLQSHFAVSGDTTSKTLSVQPRCGLRSANQVAIAVVT